MKNRLYLAIGLLLIVFVPFLGSAVPLEAKEEPSAFELALGPKTLAILPFENNSITDPGKYEPLSKGLSAMLITDLSQAGTSLKLIERGKIQSLLKEIALSQSGIVDDSAAIRAGKILGAQNIAFGSFVVFGNIVRIDTRIIKVETGELVRAESITGDSSNFMNLERELAKKIAASLKVAFMPKTTASGSGIAAALYFSNGLDAMDRGNNEEAKQLFLKSIRIDPAYKIQVNNVQGLNL
jgi:TolB-like protein